MTRGVPRHGRRRRSAPTGPDLFGLVVGSLFTGYGGLDLAARSVLGDVTVAWHSDIKPAAVRLLRTRHPGAPNLGSVVLVDFRKVTPVDVLTFGWPCQPHSLTGKGLGVLDRRALWPFVARAVRQLRPPVLIGENVENVTRNGELARVLASLAALGYAAVWRVDAASDLVGACHRRRRLVLVAVDTRADRSRLDRVARALGDPAAPAAGLAAGEERLTLLPTPTQSMTTGAGTKRGGGLNLQTAVALLPAVDGPDRWGDYAAAVTRHAARFEAPAPDPALTLPRSRVPYPQLSPVFVEWMMGLPPGWVTSSRILGTEAPGMAAVQLTDTGRADSERAAMLSLLGDGVVVPSIAAQVRHLLPLALAEATAPSAPALADEVSAA